MLHFECPSCKMQLQADNDYAGKLVVCPKCQQTAPVPSSPATSEATAVTTPDVADAAQLAKSRWHDDDRAGEHARSIVRTARQPLRSM